MNKLTILIIVSVFWIKFINSTLVELQEISKIISSSKVIGTYHIDHATFPPGKRDKMFDYGTVRTRKYNRTTFALDGDYYILLPFSDDMLFKVDLYAWQGNEYRKLADRSVHQPCSIMRNDIIYMPEILKRTNMDPNYTCPVPPMRVVLNNLVVPNIPVTPGYTMSDRFRINITLLSSEKEIMGEYAVYIVKDA